MFCRDLVVFPTIFSTVGSRSSASFVHQEHARSILPHLTALGGNEGADAWIRETTNIYNACSGETSFSYQTELAKRPNFNTLPKFCVGLENNCIRVFGIANVRCTSLSARTFSFVFWFARVRNSKLKGSPLAAPFQAMQKREEMKA